MAAALAVAMAWSALTAVDAQQAQPQAAQASSAAANPNAYASTYKPFPSRTTVIRNATILTAAGPLIERGSVLLQDGKIAAVGQSVNAPADAVDDRRERQVGHAGRDRHALASRRLRGSRASSRCRTATR